MLGRNMDPIVYKDVLTTFTERLELQNTNQIDEKAWNVAKGEKN